MNETAQIDYNQLFTIFIPPFLVGLFTLLGIYLTSRNQRKRESKDREYRLHRDIYMEAVVSVTAMEYHLLSFAKTYIDPKERNDSLQNQPGLVRLSIIADLETSKIINDFGRYFTEKVAELNMMLFDFRRAAHQLKYEEDMHSLKTRRVFELSTALMPDSGADQSQIQHELEQLQIEFDNEEAELPARRTEIFNRMFDLTEHAILATIGAREMAARVLPVIRRKLDIPTDEPGYSNQLREELEYYRTQARKYLSDLKEKFQNEAGSQPFDMDIP